MTVLADDGVWAAVTLNTRRQSDSKSVVKSGAYSRAISSSSMRSTRDATRLRGTSRLGGDCGPTGGGGEMDVTYKGCMRRPRSANLFAFSFFLVPDAQGVIECTP